jgi:hypothetical protein
MVELRSLSAGVSGIREEIRIISYQYEASNQIQQAEEHRPQTTKVELQVPEDVRNEQRANNDQLF